jgi:TPR repeat protein
MIKRSAKSRAVINAAVLAATAFGMMLASAPAQADVKAGVDSWSRGEYNKAVENWRPLAIAGDADAAFNLGQAYKLGRGLPVDLALAEEWYRKAAVQGHIQAEDAYGLTLFQNNKRDEAVRWLERSSARGEPRAQLVLGTMLFNGDSVKKDWVRAYALVTRSAASGLPQGGQTLGQMDQYIPADVRQRGIALARDYEAAIDQPRNEVAVAVAGQGSPGAVKTAEKPTKSAAVSPKPIAIASPALEASKPAPRPVVGKGWRVQFGAFRDEGNARGLWQQLAAKVGALGGLQPVYARSGTLTKLQAGPLGSSADVAQLCRAVTAKLPGTPCVPVAP